MDVHQIYQLAIAVGLGLIVGIQRQTQGSPVAGIRTITLITVFGFLAGSLAAPLGGSLVLTGLVVVTGFLIMGNVMRARLGDPHPGVTSEVATAAMYLVGVLVALEWTTLAVVTTGFVVLLLHWKGELRSIADRLTEQDRRALAQLILLGFVILPALPNREMGPYGVLNPYDIWRMVVLIVGISLGAYIAYKFVGGRAGTLLAGTLGGLISSTASTMTFSHLTREIEGREAAASVMILIASTVVFIRVLAEIALVAPGELQSLGPPILVMGGAMALVSAGMYRWAGEGIDAPAPEDPPSDLRAAVLFGALYALILVAVAFAQRYWGGGGLYFIAFISGLTDMDAITLSSANLVEDGVLPAGTAWRMILVGGMSNLMFKGGIVAVAGSRALRKPVALGFGLSIAAGTLILLLWP
jgi:uncharacterized membrane protein (DUF4010 family)